MFDRGHYLVQDPELLESFVRRAFVHLLLNSGFMFRKRGGMSAKLKELSAPFKQPVKELNLCSLQLFPISECCVVSLW